MKRSAEILSMATLSFVLLSQQALAQALPAGTNSGSVKLASVEANHPGEAKFSALVDKYFDASFKRDPNWATKFGFHQYDNMAPDYSAAAVADEINEIKDFQKQFAEIKADSLGAQSRYDLRMLTNSMKSRLLGLEEMKDWVVDPDQYSSEANAMVFELMKRDFAPLSDRLKSVIAREKKIKDLLAAGKANVKNPPKIYTQIALDQMPGMISFFQNAVPECFKGVTDKALQAEFKATNDGVIEQLKDYEKFLKEDLLPRSNGNFAIGSDFYAKKLLYDQMVDTPIDKLISDGYTELKRLQKEFERTAKEIDSSKTPAEVMTIVSTDHPAPDKLIPDTQAVLQHLKDYCIKNNIVTIPPENNLHVAETPPFKRALSFASMDTPGPYETKATEAYYYVTLPEADWSKERTEEHMRAFCKYDLINTSVHEAYPGHYVQGLWDKNAPSKTAKILGCGSNVEGWAHYCEQMLVDEGLENHDKKLELIMWHDALLRCCRYIVGLSMHTKGMSMDEGIAFFMKEGYQEKANAERETKRGTASPTYLIYTLGKLQILALRDDYKKLKGDKFTLKDFHDRFLATGRPPVKIIREVMLGEGK